MPDIDWGRILEIGLSVVALPCLVWVVVTMQKITIILFGATGNNGMHSEVKSLQGARYDHDTRLNAAEFRIESLEGRMEFPDRRQGNA